MFYPTGLMEGPGFDVRRVCVRSPPPPDQRGHQRLYQTLGQGLCDVLCLSDVSWRRRSAAFPSRMAEAQQPQGIPAIQVADGYARVGTLVQIKGDGDSLTVKGLLDAASLWCGLAWAGNVWCACVAGGGRGLFSFQGVL